MGPLVVPKLLIHSLFPMQNKHEVKTKIEFRIFFFRKARKETGFGRFLRAYVYLKVSRMLFILQ